MTMIGPDSTFIIEFKVDMPNEAAICQIETKKYYEKYLSENKKIYLVGIHFDSEERNIMGFEWKEKLRWLEVKVERLLRFAAFAMTMHWIT